MLDGLFQALLGEPVPAALAKERTALTELDRIDPARGALASTGEGVKDIEVFHPDRMAGRILDMGDVLTLIEQAERAFERGEAEEMQRKFLAEEDFTFDDFLQQMSAIKRMGSLKSMLKMMPGMGQMSAQLDNLDEREFDRVEAMVRSMTPFERTHPKQINGSRRSRIAKGSGVTVSEVNQLLERFTEAQKMMKQLARGGGMPGMPRPPGPPGPPRPPGPPPPGPNSPSTRGPAVMMDPLFSVAIVSTV